MATRRKKFNWCPSNSPVVRVELHDIAPRTAITKEARLPSLASMLSRLKPPCTTTSHKWRPREGGWTGSPGCPKGTSQRDPSPAVLPQARPSPPTAEAVQTPTQDPNLVGGEDNHRCPCPDQYPNRGSMASLGAAALECGWPQSIRPLERPMIGDEHPIPRLIPEPTHRTRGLHSCPEVYRHTRQALREFHPYVDGEFTTGL